MFQWINLIFSNLASVCERYMSLAGKTTIADALVASNGIISQRLAGKVSLYYNWLDFTTTAN